MYFNIPLIPLFFFTFHFILFAPYSPLSTVYSSSISSVASQGVYAIRTCGAYRDKLRPWLVTLGAPRIAYPPDTVSSAETERPTTHQGYSNVFAEQTTHKMSSPLPANARISTNPFLESKLNHLRDRSLGSSAVRATTAEIARILAVEATQNHKPDHGKIGLIVVLRSGLGMSDAFLAQFAPDTDVVVYHIGMFREKYSLQPVEYYNKLPNNNTEIKRVYVIDPLIATGGTATAVIEILRDWGVEHITFVSMLTSQQGLEHAAKAWPEGTEFVIGAIDPRLDASGYIEPGIGDIGDRLFGTGLSH